MILLLTGIPEEAVSKKKKHLNETEIALKREETARKRKNLSAKKLEDEKVWLAFRFQVFSHTEHA